MRGRRRIRKPQRGFELLEPRAMLASGSLLAAATAHPPPTSHANQSNLSAMVSTLKPGSNLAKALLAAGAQVNASAPTFLKGDINLDGKVNGGDIAPMLRALANIAGYQSSHDLTDEQLLQVADINND